jgi:hypothetical protein
MFYNRLLVMYIRYILITAEKSSVISTVSRSNGITNIGNRTDSQKGLRSLRRHVWYKRV